MHEMPKLLIVGVIVVISFYAGKAVKWLKLPSIIGFMLVGVIAGPSLLDVANEQMQQALSFITEIALAVVALSIGLELSFHALKRQGSGIIAIILAESFGAFVVVTAAVFLLTRDWALSLIFGAIAPASAPAGTVAVIQEYKARGSLTKALYAVVGFDDGLGIIIFGFAAAIARSILQYKTGGHSETLIRMLEAPLLEVILSIGLGCAAGLAFCILARRLDDRQDTFILVFGLTLATTGLCAVLHLSLILTNMIVGIFVVNTQPHGFTQRIGDELLNIMPLLFVLFFTLAGANLHLNALPELGVLGIVYVLARSAGLVGGSRVGAILGRTEEKIKNYVGLGILSQAGVAIGLSLIVKHEFAGLGSVLGMVDGHPFTSGDQIGATVITTVTATCIFFELIGPVLTKVALTKAGEIYQGEPVAHRKSG